ncbi:MAG: universal stress protein [Gracilimonas sp.]|uniref:universal stress protein n=1 Tax=Gracilimonas sp. TaxID=1974203 RepID=UPI0019C012A4|nr:universal stress protein [Gracilimonas sp.]MBD3617736.1 universal stress protein [Gracilimonas sp.]
MKARHILVPTDFSEASLEAVKMAAKFVELYDSTVDLIHVIPLMSYYDESMQHLGVPFDMEKDIYPKVLKETSQKLHEIAEEFIPKEHRGQLINLVGRKPAQVIADQAGKSQYDLVIMANKGSHDTDALRSGVTEKVIRFSQKPVLSLNTAFDEKAINKILVPVDGSDDSAAPLVQAFDLALTFDAELVLMHIIEPYSLGMEVMPMTIEDDKAVYHSLIKNIVKYFDKNPELGFSIKREGDEFEDYLVREADGNTKSVKMTSIVKKGFSAHTEICDYANENIDLVVMSTHGRTGIARVLLGSTTGIVAQHLNKPLMTLRPG